MQSLCAKGELERALELLCTIDKPPSANTYLSLLKACKRNRRNSLSHARQVYAHITHHNIPLSGLLGDYLVVTLSICGALEEAITIHSELPQRSVHSWTSLIFSYTESGQAADALKCYEQMLQDGLDPTSHTFVGALSACASRLDLDQGRTLHAYVCLKGLACDASIGNAIVCMYADCCALVDAEQVFFNLSEHSQFAWNSMLSLCVDQGQARKAINWYAHMKSDDVEPNHYTFIILFKACESIADLEQGRSLHNDACVEGYASDVMVGSTLINMYGKLGAIGEAEEVFGKLSHRDVAAWNSLLAAYVAEGLGRKALHLYRQMQEVGVDSTQRTYVTALRACATLAEVKDVPSLGELAVKKVAYHIGQALHADTCKKEFLSDARFLHNTLVSIYGKFGQISEAEHVFGSLLHRDIVTWNAMLSAYAELGEGAKALRLLLQMEKESINPDQTTFVGALQAVALVEGEVAPVSDGRFSKKMSLEIGHALHGGVCRSFLASDVTVGCALVSMYGRCGSITEAEHTFSTLTQHTVVAWNAMMSAYVEQGDGEKALRCFAQMQVDGHRPDQITSILALQACGTLADKEVFFFDKGVSIKEVSLILGKALHADIARGCFAFDVSISNSLVNLYGKCGAIVEAENVFCGLTNRTVVSWNALLLAYAENDQGEKALLLYTQMRKESLRPDLPTFLYVLQACIGFAEKENVLELSVKFFLLEIGHALHVDSNTEGFRSNAGICNSLVRMYGKCGAIIEAEDMCGDLDPANVCSAFSSQDMSSWNLMLSAYAENGLGQGTVQIYRQMQDLGVPMTLMSLTRMLQSCSSVESKDVCQELHFISISAGLDQAFYLTATLIHAYGSCASMLDADTSLQALSMLDIVSWSACIAGHAGVGDSLASLYMFDQLKLSNAQPSSSTFISVLSACTQNGLPSGLHYFESMTRDFCLMPEAKHHCILADLYGRTGDLEKVELLLDNEMVHNNWITWLALLGACRTHCNSAMAKQAYDHAMKIQPNQSTAYILMSNIYADTQMDEYLDD
ncbi:hypothetical protein GOP47_0020496 [Adiantum capillus-veneris]|uniref:Pentatricopeptide repeat-containing protein n=1 Tax=Adiantum capillus-veneris TaxID=13818 RepID=A0A9D4UB67_ADICA|nr:hypothetical protein GOP47_0020496 [Adiantum capillus-veneris]